MNGKAKRPWFRFHLLTAVLMMVAGGIVIGMNVHQWNPEATKLGGPAFYQGWPFAFFEGYPPTTINIPGLYVDGFQLQWLVIDAGVTLLILCVIALISESLIRRHEGHRT